MTAADGTRVIRLDAVPVALVLRSQDHLDELVRELQIIAIGVATATTDEPSPGRLASLVSEALERLDTMRAMTREQVRAAAEAGSETVALEITIPEGAAADIHQLVDLLDEADRLCEEGALLTLASPPEVRAFRREMAEQLVRQLTG